ncbi:uncharacterized protein PV09_09035 [Verruconis gallopava]|uniref:mRNA stability protein n=1 Tax=Verruconis gallopava TaxID=253628 RepID=A0A0D1XAM4_9PEZI|nr:uncharacterized protein PV09_09035 [Verruconis gallopava]KIV99265.1 hypothetical protein PV09_09035 [Verruconis gallopava]
MNPLQQKQKVDISSLSPDEQRLFRMYGKLPNKKDLLQNKLKERKYFDSGDYALSKAGKASDVGVTQIGREHPVPENIPHSSATSHASHNGSISASPGTIPGQNLAGGLARGASPVKEGSHLQRERSASDIDDEDAEDEQQGSGHAKPRPIAIEK